MNFEFGSILSGNVGIIVALATVVIAAKFLLGSNSGTSKGDHSPVVSQVLDAKNYKKFTLAEKIPINHNTRIFRFALPKPNDVLGLPIGQHLSLKIVVDGKDVYRSYTPVSSDDDLGHFDLVVKVYEKGAMSKYLDTMNIGDSIDVRGPKGSFVYQANMRKSFGMLAGGTGITPMLQIIRAILKNPKDTTEIRLIFANVNADDILLREELDALATIHKNFQIRYVLNNPPEGWTGGVGFISKDMIERFCHPSHNDTMMLMCGPPLMMKAMQTNLESLNYKEEHIFSF